MTKNKNVYYIYEWYNVDTGEVFYVGKGKGNRYKYTKGRNNYFKHYFSKYKCDVRKVKTKLSESSAFKIEKKLIKEYRLKGECKCNIASGGEGSSWKDNPDKGYVAKRYILLYMSRTNVTNKYCLEEDEVIILEDLLRDNNIDKKDDVFALSDEKAIALYDKINMELYDYKLSMVMGAEYLSYLDDDE